jgi:hypothetical protein
VDGGAVGAGRAGEEALVAAEGAEELGVGLEGEARREEDALRKVAERNSERRSPKR